MKQTILCLFCCLLIHPATAQIKNFTYKFYGFVRGDLFYNSRQNVDAIDGNFYLYPMDKDLDEDGKDINASPNSSFYTFTTRLGVDLTGPRVGSAKSSAKIEMDFGGFSSAFYMLRLRQAYVNLSWNSGSSLLLGQTWHPLFGDVSPEVLNLSTGSPFQPFSRTPQFRYQYKTKNVSLTASALYQLMHTSSGPNGKSEEYQKNGIWPELFAGINFHSNGFLGGVGIEMLSLKPRLKSEMEGKTYKVNERITTLSYMAQMQYRTKNLYLAAKTFLASNLTHTVMVGGYGVSTIDPKTGKQEYTGSRHSSTWVNMVYGTKWKYGVFFGYLKNLGTKDELYSTDMFYGSGVDIDKIASGIAHVSYNLPHWKLGVEYCLAGAWYGDTDLSNGKVKNTHSVTNHRILALLTYHF